MLLDMCDHLLSLPTTEWVAKTKICPPPPNAFCCKFQRIDSIHKKKSRVAFYSRKDHYDEDNLKNEDICTTDDTLKIKDD